MIYYSVQTAAAHPDLRCGIPPGGLLNAAEQRRFCALRTPKRQREWLLGRWTAKRLLQAYFAAQGGEWRALDSFTIINLPNGVPMVTCVYPSCLALSISHRDDHAFCAISAPQELGDLSAHLGADIERVEPRAPNFVDDYFTEAESACVRRAPADQRDLLTTTIWSAKEAALKALHLGLTVDTRTVSCAVGSAASDTRTWNCFNLWYDVTPLNHHAVSLKGWWRTWQDYVLTLVTEEANCHSVDEIMHVTCGSPFMLRRPMHATGPEATE
jgi:4'-phosphopantetheinyl transferase